MDSSEVWDFYGIPPKERDNAKSKNTKWEVSGMGRSTKTSFIILVEVLDL